MHKLSPSQYMCKLQTGGVSTPSTVGLSPLPYSSLDAHNPEMTRGGLVVGRAVALVSECIGNMNAT